MLKTLSVSIKNLKEVKKKNTITFFPFLNSHCPVLAVNFPLTGN